MTVGQSHTYTVGEAQVWVHNSKKCNSGGGKKKKDSSKNEQHGDLGRANAKAKADKQLNDLQKKIDNATDREKKKLEQKKKNIIKDAKKKTKGENHSRRGK